MPLSSTMARLNRVGLNRLTIRIAPWAPGFGVVSHVGRTSGRSFRTPINVFRRGDTFVFALTYGSGAQWVRNVRAAGGCELETRRRRYRLSAPEVYVDETRAAMPVVVRRILTLVEVSEFMVLRIDGPADV